jgi:hypothetical protein
MHFVYQAEMRMSDLVCCHAGVQNLVGVDEPGKENGAGENP